MGWKDKALITVYWLFWATVCTLAAQEAIYLARGYGQWEWALAAGLFIAGAKWWVTFSSRNTLDEERRISSLFIKRLLLRSGPVPNSIYRIDDPDADPAFAVIVDETIGLEGYEEGLANAKADWSNGHHMPPEVVAQLSKWPQMNAIDRKLVAVAKRIGSADHKNLLHDIRVIVMREMYRRIDPNATDPFPMALNEIIAEVPRLSPIYRLLDATRKEYTGQDSRGIRIGSWEIAESWLEVVPPAKFEDICGGDGRALPPPPAIIEDSLKPKPPGRTYYS